MADDNGTFELSRRKALAGLGTIGVASAGAGLGTSAFFSDTENFTGNSITAGELDMKVGYSAHYSDWSPDEDGGDTDTTDDDVDVVMWDGAPNTTGTASDLPEGYTGLPTNDAWLIAVDDPGQFLDNTQYSDPADDGASCDPGNDDDDLTEPVAIELGDVKPGDFGEVTFDFALCDNPGFVWLQGEITDKAENGVNEPEADDGDEDQREGSGDPDLKQDIIDGNIDDPNASGKTVELLDVVQAAVWVDDGNNYQNGDESPQVVGSLRDVLSALNADATASTPDLGFPLAGDTPAEEGGGSSDARNCFAGDGEEHSVAFAWWVPVDHGNEIQSDSVTFDLSFYTEQCRHNDGSGQAAES